ncbi:hypothetical protein E5K00_00375 [Hymenobacter aquaticus]|uniref:VCBS repeat-containing protein n=1 Tax=Hymenobacter aquaticus TaxID=1867101 RepID=A0A4Z0Q4S0_9BACT|nr:hypothetical protein [Hymenobacter aquaticus]TGE23702.1 hypothetical protein E5K00_00375 [Hymenobacter aquaticus]
MLRTALFLLLLSAFSAAPCGAQTPPTTSVVLTTGQARALLPDAVKRELRITYPVFRVYKCPDKTGLRYYVLTESRDVVAEGNDTLNRRIQAVVLTAPGGKLTRSWEVNDFVDQAREEKSIWFWTKYCAFQDYDRDGEIDPILVYGTSAGDDEGRIKLILYYRGRKIALRHQAGVLDIQRSIQVEKAFYALPAAMQAAVRHKLALLEKDNLTILPHGWPEAMRRKATVINDSYYSTK